MKSIIELEKKVWDIFLSDEYYKKYSKDISHVDKESFIERYEILIKNFVELKHDSKEREIIKTLFKKYNYNSEIFIFQGDIVKGFKQAGVYDFGDKTIFIFSKILIDSFLEYDLLPIISHEIGHLINKTPITPPFYYFWDKLVAKDKTMINNGVRRLFVLSSYLAHITEYRADNFALENTGQLENVLNSLNKLDRLNNKVQQEFNVYKVINDYVRLRKRKKYDITEEELINDHPSMAARIYYLFLESKRNKLIYSQSISDLDSSISFDEFFDFDYIVKTYKELV